MKISTALDFVRQNKQIQDAIVTSVAEEFPIKTNKKILSIENIEVGKSIATNDYPALKELKLNRKSLLTPVYAKVTLSDENTGKVIHQIDKFKLINIPKMTRWYSMIIDGNEYQTVNQLRLKSGIYTRIKNNGDLESRFNLEKGFNFTMILPPDKGIFYLVTKNAKYRLYNILHSLDIPDSKIIEIWGKEIFDKNLKNALNTEQADIIQLYKELTRNKNKPVEYLTALQGLKEYFANTRVSKETTKITLGTSFDRVSPAAFLATSKKLLEVMRGNEKPDERESLIFKNLYGVEDLVTQYFDKNKENIVNKLKFRINKKDNIREILSSSTYSKPIKEFFTREDLASTPTQTNPAQILADAQKVTFMGTGGIGSRFAITTEVRNLHPTHLNFLDPLATPDSARAGVNLGLTRDIVKDGQDIKTSIRMLDGSRKFVSVSDFYNMKIAFSDQYALINKLPKPIKANIRCMYKGKSQIFSAKDIDAFMFSPSNMFSYTTNLIPFIGHNSGNRIAMATRMIGQALPIINREAPYVQTRWKKNQSFQKVIGNFMNPAPGENWGGEIIDINKDYVSIKKKSDGKKVKVGLFNNYPLNQESFIHNTVNVKIGDKVKPETFLAENNFTKNGVFAIGANVNVAYMPWKGLTFEDSAVVSSSFAKKFTSEKIIRKNIYFSQKEDEFNITKFRAIFPDVLTPENAKKLDEEGLPKPGQIIQPGEILAAYLTKIDLSGEEKILRKMNRGLAKPYKKQTIEWEDNNPGEIIYISKTGRNIDIHVKIKSPLVIGDKISGNYGNKAIVSIIVPDDEMPHTKDKEHMDVLFSPVTVPGRMNIGQLIEAGYGKLLDKTTKKPIIVDNFIDKNQLEVVYNKLKKNNIPIEEILTDGKDGKDFKTPIFWGKPYIMKLRHTVDHKLKSRNIGTYDINLQPSKGKESGQTMGNMEVMAMLGWGAKANLWETTALKSQQNDEYWRALQLGLPTPVPKANFAFEKMLSYLKQAGVNVEKEGNKITLMPMTDTEVKKISGGEVTDGGKMLIAKNLKNIPGGLFDSEVFGGIGGKKWGHINLAVKIPNPIMEDPIIKLLNLTQPKFNAIISEKENLNGKTGLGAIEHGLSLIDINPEIKKLRTELAIAPPQKINVINKKIRYLQALKKFNLKPTDYMIKKIPVLPPIYRPIYPLPSGDLMISPINKHYRDVFLINQAIKDIKNKDLPEDVFNQKNKLSLYRAVKSMQGLIEPLTYSKEKYEGAIKSLAGSSPKYGFIHDKLFSKKQDMSARSTIGLEPSLGIDEVGLPEDMLKKLYKPFVMRKLVQGGIPATQAIKEIKNWTTYADKTLDVVINERPILLNRAPTLHKHGIQAFKVKRVPGKMIKMNPLVLSGFNADTDGDQQINNVIIFLLDIYKEMYYIKIRGYNKNFFNQRKIMPSRLNVNLPYIKGGNFYVVNLEDFPYLENELISKKDHITFYKADKYLKVIALDETTGKFILADVSGWSIHKDRETWTISLKNKRQIISDDDPRAVYGIDSDTLKYKRSTPKDSLGRLVPYSKSIIDISNSNNITEIHGYGRLKEIINLNKDFGYFVGACVGDGWVDVRKNKPIVVNLAGIEKTIIKKYSKIANSLFIKGCHVGHRINKNSYGKSEKHIISSVDLASLILPMIGKGAKNKHLPPFWFSAPRNFKIGLLSGLLDTDGSISISNGKKKPQLMANISSISIRLLQEVQQLLLSLNISSSISTGKTPKGEPFWSLGISSIGISNIKNELCNVHEKNIKNLNSITPNSESPAYIRMDLVPFNAEICNIVKTKIFNLDKSLYSIISKQKNLGYISRSAAFRIINITKKYNIILPKIWLNFAKNKKISWSPVVSVKNNGIKETGYDLTVPGYETFMSIDGTILSNTMAVHVPIGTDAVNEAWGMLPSKNVFKHGDNAVVPQISQEYQFGLYFLTKAGKETKKSFNTVSEAKIAGLALTDVFMLKNKKTTIGRELINKTIPTKLRVYDKAFDKNVVNNILTNVAKQYPNDFENMINSFKDLSHSYAHERSSTVSLTDFMGSKKYRDDIIGIYKDKIKKDPKNKIKLWIEAQEKVQKAQDKEFSGKNNMYDWIESGGMGKKGKGGIMQILSMPGVISDVHGEAIEQPVLKSYGEGLNVPDYWNTMCGVRKGIIDTAVSTSQPGALSKALMSNIWSTIIITANCETTKGIELDVASDAKNIIDRVLLETISGVGKRDDVIDSRIYNRLKQKKIKKVMVRSPLTCEAINGICQKCYGLLPTGQFPEIGYNVGVNDAAAVTERSTQLILRTKHTGAALTTDTKETEGFPRLVQLLKVPEIVAGKAILSPVSGIIKNIKPDALGGYNITIDKEIVNIPSGKTLLIKLFDKVKKGDRLTSGPIRPQELADLVSHEEAQLYMVNELDKTYREDFHKKTFETIIRAISSTARVLETPEKSDLLRGDSRSIQDLKNENRSRKEMGLSPVLFKPFFKSIEVLPGERDDWLSRMATNRIVSTIRDAAGTGMSTNIHGSDPLPAYLYGSDFGKEISPEKGRFY